MSLLYEKIASILRRRIDDAKYAVGSKIPSEAELAQELNVSRPTIKSAVRQLEKEGILVCRAAVGSYVRKRSGEKLLIGYLTPDIADPFHSEFIQQISKKLRTYNGNLVVSELAGNQVEKEDVYRLMDAGCKGIILSPLPSSNPALSEINIPLVVYGHRLKNLTGNFVLIDNETGIKSLLNHLKTEGVTTVGYAGGYEFPPENEIRRKTFLKYVKKLGLMTKPAWNRYVPLPGEEGGKQLFEDFKATGELPDAILCYNDWNAIGLISAALENSVSVPDELKVTGFDNLMISEYFKVPLTTIDCNIPKLVDASLKIIIKILQGHQENQSVPVDIELIIRQSTGR